MENNKRFLIFDALGTLKYTVSIEHASFGTKISVYDFKMKRVAKIRKRDVMSFSIFSIFCKKVLCNKRKIRLVVSRLNFKDFVYIAGINWFFSGSLLDKNFEIVNVDKSVVMRQTKNNNTLNAAYELDINEEQHEILCLCVALCVNILSAKPIKNTIKAVGLAD